MPTYLVETFLPRGAAPERRAHVQALGSAVASLTPPGMPVSFGGLIYVPDDEQCLLRVDAPSVGHAERIALPAGLRLLRVVEAITSNGRGRPW